MKKIILAAVSAFALSILGSAAFACDGDKGHVKGDKADKSSTQSSPAAQKDGKTKTSQKS